jgi:hypothetical protein
MESFLLLDAKEPGTKTFVPHGFSVVGGSENASVFCAEPVPQFTCDALP